MCVCFFRISQDNLESDVRPFKAFHYNGLGVREADGTKKVHANDINDDYKASLQFRMRKKMKVTVDF